MLSSLGKRAKKRVASLATKAGNTGVGKAARVAARAATAAGATALLGPLATVMGPLMGLMAFVQTLQFDG